MLNFFAQTLTSSQAIDLFTKGVATAISVIVACSRVKPKK